MARVYCAARLRIPPKLVAITRDQQQTGIVQRTVQVYVYHGDCLALISRLVPYSEVDSLEDDYGEESFP